jgi:hypothetical protein
MSNLENQPYEFFDIDIASCYGAGKTEKTQMEKLIRNTTYGITACKNYALEDLEIYTTIEPLINGGCCYSITDGSEFYLHN